MGVKSGSAEEEAEFDSKEYTQWVSSLPCLPPEGGGKKQVPPGTGGRVGHNTQFGGPRAASKLIAPRGETLLTFPPRSENIIEQARGEEGRRGVGRWVRTSCEDRQTQTVLNKQKSSGKKWRRGI